MTNKGCTTQQPTKRRGGRPRRELSFSEWMAKVDTEVETMARKISSRIPLSNLLNPAQRRILEMAAECMRNLPLLRADEDPFEVYPAAKSMLTGIFRMKNPTWKTDKRGLWFIDELPEDQQELYSYLRRNQERERWQERFMTQANQ